MNSRYRIVYRNLDDKFCRQFKTQWLIVAIGKFLSLRGEYDIVELYYCGA